MFALNYANVYLNIQYTSRQPGVQFSELSNIASAELSTLSADVLFPPLSLSLSLSLSLALSLSLSLSHSFSFL